MLMPSMERVRFVSSGTEAAMSAVRVARAATKRDRIVKFEGCYHGHADAFLVQAGSGAMTLGVPTSPGVPAAVAARHAARAVQRSRLGRTRDRATTAGRSPRSSSSRSPATWGWCRRATDSSQGCARSATRARRAARVRRGDLGLPRRRRAARSSCSGSARTSPASARSSAVGCRSGRTAAAPT